eukprot:CAMPEP_0183416210 /NCGR_PEP_ID=MMETSP0370-20130417/23612_1 /TAXON_ID=268820 /ORGANISM="Peridinium aciculiferum, Strain PAER-2" /LENGTH=123 /DNA_ID=CAMNT_0025599709 /DNA_START=106 /DNA_END=475 /DNA_ORIENTATION=-
MTSATSGGARAPSTSLPVLNAVSVARSAVRLAMLVVEEYEPDEGGPKNKCEQAQEVGLRRELQLVNLRHALRRCDVQIDPAAKSEEEAHNTAVHLCGVDDHHAEHHAKPDKKLRRSALAGVMP